MSLGLVKPDRKASYSARERVAMEDTVIISLAGGLAEGRFSGASYELDPDNRRTRDERLAVALAHLMSLNEVDQDKVFRVSIAELQREARILIDENWDLIETLANELITQRTMDGATIEETLYRRLGVEPRTLGV
jgi:hypothetical protein